jgi:hypothetical protein
MGRAFSSFSGAPWGQAGPGAGSGNLTIGVSLGSGYQHYFSGLSSQAQNTEIARMQAAGITWVRLDIAWTSTVQSARGATCDFSYPLLTAQPMLDAGINVLAILLWSPSWAWAVGNNPATPANTFPTIAPADYAAFAGQAAAQLGPLGISAFELWNEPNLDRFDLAYTPGGSLAPSPGALGLGCFSAMGYPALATAAYTAIHEQYVAKPGYSPTPTVVGAVMSAEARLDYSPSPRSGASWPAVAAGATSATVTYANAPSADQYLLITGNAVSLSTSSTGTGGMWPAGTYVSQVTSTGYVLSPPPWLSAFPDAVNASTSSSTFGMGTGYPPDLFLTQLYAGAGTQPMYDAMSIHPYVWPSVDGFRYIDSGSWAMVPALRQIMVANGDGAKAIWFTETGAPTGQCRGTWSAAAATATELVVSSASAKAEDLGYLVGAPGLPAGSYVAAVSPGQSWTVLPPTGLTVAQTLTPGASISTLQVQAGSSAVTVGSNTALTVWFGDTNGYSGQSLNGFAQGSFTVTTTDQGPWTVPASASGQSPTTLDIGATSVPGGSSAPSAPAGGQVQCAQSLGQTWGSAIAAGSGAVVNLVAPGVLAPWAVVPLSQTPAIISSEAQQALVIAYGMQFLGSTPWPYVGPVFVYCWSDASGDNNAGPFGLTRVDGSAKPALSALAALGQSGGNAPGVGLPQYVI